MNPDEIKVNRFYMVDGKRPRFIRVIKVWEVGTLEGGMKDTVGRCEVSKEISPFISIDESNFTPDWVSKEISKEKYPEYYLWW